MQNKLITNTFISYKNFYLMVIGQIISILGSALLRFALSLYVLDITGRADIYAVLYAVSNIALLISPIGGAIADRFNKRNLMVIFDFISSAIISFYCLSLSFTNSSILITGIVMVLLSIISSMYQPVVMASIPLLVEKSKLEQSNGIVNGVQALSNVAAPVIGGIIYGITGIKTLVLFSAIAFFSSAILEIFIYIPFQKRKLTMSIMATFKTDIKSGFSYIQKNSFIFKFIILGAFINMILTPFFVVGAPIILKITMNSTDNMYGIGMGIINFATILGAFMMGVVSSKLQIKTIHNWLLVTAVFIIPIAISVTPIITNKGFYPSYLLFLIFTVPIAMILMILSIFLITKVQKETPNELLGKVMSTIIAVSQCAAPIGQLIYGIAFQKFQTTLYIPILFISICMFILSISVKYMYCKKEIK